MTTQHEQREAIRAAERPDYEELAGLWSAVYPDDRYTAEELYHRDTAHRPPCLCAQFVLRREGRLLGASSYEQFIGMYHPHKFVVNVLVAPEARGQGLGRALYRHLLEQLAPFDPLSLRVQVSEGEPAALAFATRRGFAETKRDWQARLELAGFDPAPYAARIAALEAEGTRFLRLPELGEGAERRLHALFSELRQDVPRSEPATPIDFAAFEALFLSAPDFWRDGVFLAEREGELIGMTMFWRSERGDALHTGLTGVKRGYRGRGLATALKVRALEFARRSGAPRVYTDNDTQNVEMIAVNAKLGFQRQPARISLRRTLREEA